MLGQLFPQSCGHRTTQGSSGDSRARPCGDNLGENSNKTHLHYLMLGAAVRPGLGSGVTVTQMTTSTCVGAWGALSKGKLGEEKKQGENCLGREQS